MNKAIKDLGNIVEENHKRRREAYLQFLRMLHTASGVLVLGIVLAGIAIVSLLAARSTPRRVPVIPEGNSVIIGVEDFLEDDEIWRQFLIDQEQQIKEEREGKITRARVFAVCALACFGYAAILWKKKKTAAAEKTPAGTFGGPKTSIEERFDEVAGVPVEKSAPEKKSDRQENLKRLYEAGILSKEEYRRKCKER